MEIILPELKPGDVLVKHDSKHGIYVLTVRKVGKGKEFDEPVYFLTGQYGVKLKNAYTGEELAGLGYSLKTTCDTNGDNNHA